jgi:hypothetical protein
MGLIGCFGRFLAETTAADNSGREGLGYLPAAARALII